MADKIKFLKPIDFNYKAVSNLPDVGISKASNIINGEIDLSLKTKDAKYDILVTKLVELTSKTEAEVKAFLALIGITTDVVNTNYGIAAQTFGINNTNYALGALISGVNNTIGNGEDPTIGILSIALGAKNTVKGQSDIAVGDSNSIIRSNGSGTFGYANVIDSRADSITLTNSFAIGNHLINNYSWSTVVGKYNLPYQDGKDLLFQVGNGAAGTEEDPNKNRHNAFEVHSDGHATVGKIGTEDLSVATKGYVDGHHDASKQDTIYDLTTIRSGATAGATALQPSSPVLSAMGSDNLSVATKKYVDDHVNLFKHKITISNTSSLHHHVYIISNNGSKYVTAGALYDDFDTGKILSITEVKETVSGSIATTAAETCRISAIDSENQSIGFNLTIYANATSVCAYASKTDTINDEIII